MQLLPEILEPYAEALVTIRECSFKATSNSEEVNYYLRWLSRIDNSDWVPAAIKFLATHKNEPQYVHWFFERVERLAAYMHICALNVNKRIKRWNRVVSDLETAHSYEAPPTAVELSKREKRSMRACLDGNVYELTSARRKYITLRLDSFISDGQASYDSKLLTIEHVLPQKVDRRSEWASIWPDLDEREQLVHKVANLVPLNSRRNSKAQNYDFGKKKEAYFAGTSGVSSYALTTQVLKCTQWTPASLAERQKELLEVFEKNWRLSPE